MGFLDFLFNPSKNTNRGYSQAVDEQKRLRELTDPYYRTQMQGGTAAYNNLADLLGLNGGDAGQAALARIPELPSYQAGMESGQRALEQSAAARGTLLSGDTLKGVNEFGQNYWYDTKYRPHLADLAGMVDRGNYGASGLTGNSQYTGNLAINKGQARDAGNQAAFGNVLGIAGTVLGAATGMPTAGGRLFGGAGGGPTQLPGYGGSSVAQYAPNYYGSSDSKLPYYAFGSGAIF